jgi:hypothetical protein
MVVKRCGQEIALLVPQLARDCLVELVSAEHGRLRLPPLSEADPAAIRCGASGWPEA